MHNKVKKLIAKNLEKVAQYSLESESLFCFYEPMVPAQLKRRNSKTEVTKKSN